MTGEATKAPRPAKRTPGWESLETRTLCAVTYASPIEWGGELPVRRP